MTGVDAGRGTGSSVERAAALVDAGRPDDGLSELAAAEREHGETAAGHRVRALALLTADRIPQQVGLPAAVRAARRAVELAPGDPAGPLVLSIVLRQAGDRQEAVVAARRAVAADPGSWQAHLAVADALSTDGRSSREARRAAAEAVRLAPTEPLAHRRLGDLLQAAGRSRAARASWHRALGLSPEDRDTRLNVAADRLRRGHDGAAAVVFAGLLATDPGNALVRRNLVVSLVDPVNRIRSAHVTLAALAVLLFIGALDRPAGPSRWTTGFPAALELALTAAFVLRFALGAGSRIRWLLASAGRAVPGWNGLVAVLAASVLAAVVGLCLPPVGGLVCQCLVLVGAAVGTVLHVRVLRAHPRRRVHDEDDEDDEDASVLDGRREGTTTG
ncbi:tetratricopeptide repeat protein [Curtobacterium sp. MCBD17_032]|uniref:tetratricopeptide repeat protein n=1 Tax=Curtobacterium sp. MCBD17_032 TaxID=2175659 RepID=UPI0015E8D5B4|nr:tetratricopeptide repeat protein [Curtobacterium sp. MCBD17_032]